VKKAYKGGEEMKDLIREIEQVTKKLSKIHADNRDTETALLPKNLPQKQIIVDLKIAAADILALWGFYENYQLGKQLDKELANRPKPKIKPRKHGYSIEEDIALGGRPRDHI